MSPPLRPIRFAELRTHHGAQTALPWWTALDGVVYDVGEFARTHPGGERVLREVAGKDGTKPFTAVHPRDLAAKMLPAAKVVGTLDASDAVDGDVASIAKHRSDDASAEIDASKQPPLDQMLNAFDFEAVARVSLPREAWGYYSSGGDDEITLRENHAAFQRVWVKPRVLVNVKHIDTTTEILPGTSVGRSTLPVYLSATAMGKLAHPEGEAGIVKAAHAANVVYMLPTLSSCTLDEMLAARAPNQVVFSQLYVNSDRDKTREYVQRLEKAGVRALFVTVDAPQLGRREKDMRNKFTAQKSFVQRNDDVKRDEGVTRAISSFIDPSLCWDDVAWLKSLSKLPLFLKGVQCAEDAVLALRAGCAGIVLSNHGGRQLDTSRSGLEILAEVMPALRAQPNYRKDKFHVYIDGGVRRGLDVVKAVAMGATAVGIGRPVLYSLAGYGPDGIVRLIRVLRDEMEMAMRLMGTPRIADLTDAHVITRDLPRHASPAPRDFLAEDTYEKLQTQAARVGFGSKL